MALVMKPPDLGATFAKGIDAVVRFPLPAACALGFAGVYVVDQHFSVPASTDNLLIFLALGFFAALAGSLFAEQRKWSRALRVLASAIPFGGVAAIVFLSGREFDDIWSVYFLFLLPGLVLSVAIAPFLARSSANDAVWNFNQHAWLGAALGLAGGLLVAVAAMALFAAIETLFGVFVHSDIHGDVWVVCLAVLWPWIALSAVPEDFADPPANFAPSWIRFVSGAMLVPIASIYLVVLYVYVISILFSWDLPRGNVANVACGFAAVGVITHLICYPWRESGSRWLRVFHRYFYVLLFVPIALLAVAVGRRVGDYGVTEERYFLVLAAFWLGAIAVYLSVGGRRLLLVPLSLAVLLIPASFGPWGATAISERSQVGILHGLLTDAGLLRNNTVAPSDTPPDFTIRKRISSVADYLTSSGKHAAIAPWFTSSDADFSGDAKPDREDIVEALGFKFIGDWQDTQIFAFDGSDGTELDIAGFDFLVERRFWGSQETETFEGPAGLAISLTFNETTGALSVAVPEGPDVNFDLGRLARDLLDAGYDGLRGVEAAPLRRAMTLDAASGPFRLRLLVTRLSGDVEAAQPKKISADVILLIGYDAGGE